MFGLTPNRGLDATFTELGQNGGNVLHRDKSRALKNRPDGPGTGHALGMRI